MARPTTKSKNRVFQPTQYGYDVAATSSRIPRGQNATLSFQNQSDLGLWVYEVNTQFAMSGTMGQSPRTRSYFPHNMVQPSVNLMCQFPNLKLYGDAAEWLRYTQINLQGLISLKVIPRETGVKGLSDPIDAKGYVTDVRRTHQRFVYAPEMTLNFVILSSSAPAIWGDDTQVTPRKIKSWADIIASQKPGFIRDSDPVVAGDPAQPIPQKNPTVGHGFL